MNLGLLQPRLQRESLQSNNKIKSHFYIKVNFKLYVFSEDDNRCAEAELRQ